MERIVFDDFRRSGMKSTIAAAMAAFAALSASAETVYSTAEGTLTISVPAGETNSVDVSKVADANSNAVTKIVKTGLGGFLMDNKTAIPQFTGDIHINQGTWIIACSNALGKLDVASKGENVGKVFVADGATLDMAATDRFISNDGKKITIAGHGVSGKGALHVSHKASNFYNAVFGKNLELSADATIGMRAKFNLYFLGSDIDLNGHTLYVKEGDESGTVIVGGTGVTTEISPGKMEFGDMAILSFQGGTIMSYDSGDDSLVTFKDKSKYNSHSMHGRYEWPMVWDSDGTVTLQRQVAATTCSAETNRNTWHGPVRLDRTMNVRLSETGSFGFAGPVSGSGGFHAFWAESAAYPEPDFSTNFVNFGGAGSTFTGGVAIENLAMKVLAHNALPATEGVVVSLTNSPVVFNADINNYVLPDSVMHVDEGKTSYVRKGTGRWGDLVKTGAGTLDYDSAVGADTLEVREGIVGVSWRSGNFAGLIEGVEYFTNNTECSNAARNKDLAYTNSVVMSPYAGNIGKSYWSHKGPEWDVNNEFVSSATVYTGYMWNRETTNVNWTFCCRVATVSFFDFDGVEMINDGNYQIARLVTIEDVAPGPHKFRFGNYSQLGSGGPGTYVTNFNWHALGFRWDPLGRNSSDTNNFVVLEDPGDGSLFTWAIPGSNAFYPGTDESNVVGYLPEFDVVKFTGGTLDLDGVTLPVGAVEGVPLLSGNGKLVIEEKWTLDAADIADGLNLSGQKIGFGEAAELEVENPLAARDATGVREWTVIEAPEGEVITGSVSVKDPDVAKRWLVTVDGNRLKLKYRPVGTVVTLR